MLVTLYLCCSSISSMDPWVLCARSDGHSSWISLFRAQQLCKGCRWLQHSFLPCTDMSPFLSQCPCSWGKLLCTQAFDTRVVVGSFSGGSEFYWTILNFFLKKFEKGHVLSCTQKRKWPGASNTKIYNLPTNHSFVHSRRLLGVLASEVVPAQRLALPMALRRPKRTKLPVPRWVVGVSRNWIHLDVSKNRGGPPKWMVYSGKPYKNGGFGGTTIFGNIHLDLDFQRGNPMVVEDSTWTLMTSWKNWKGAFA